MQRPLALAIEAAPGALAVDRDHPAAAGLGGPHLLGAPDLLSEGGDEAAKAGLEGVRVQQPEQAREGVVTGNTALEAQKAAQKRLLGAPEQGHVDTGFRTTQGRRKRDQQHLQQIVALGIARARVDQILKARPKPLHAAILPKSQRRQHIQHISTPKDSTNSLCDSPVRRHPEGCFTRTLIFQRVGFSLVFAPTRRISLSLIT